MLTASNFINDTPATKEMWEAERDPGDAPYSDGAEKSHRAIIPLLLPPIPLEGPATVDPVVMRVINAPRPETSMEEAA